MPTLHDLTERELHALAQMDAINAQLSASTIAPVAAAAQQALGRSGNQLESSLARNWKGKENALDRDTLIQRARIGAAATSGDADAPNLTAMEQRKLRENQALLNSMQSTMTKARGREYVDAGTDILHSGLQSINTGLGNWFEGQAYNPSEKEVRNEIRRQIAGIRHSELGSALTGYELSKGSEWDPLAAGISKKESLQRMQTLMNELQGYQNTLTGHAVYPPEEATTKEFEVRRSLNGMSYVRIGGEWYEE